MTDREQREYLEAIRKVAQDLKKDPVARRNLLADAGILDRQTGELTEAYKPRAEVRRVSLWA